MRKGVFLRIDEDLHQKTKLLAAWRKMTVNEVVEAAIRREVEEANITVTEGE